MSSEHDSANYAKIDQLVAYFIPKMKEVGNRGLKAKPRGISPGRMRRLNLDAPIYINVMSANEKACWASEGFERNTPPIVIITPAGAWWYLGECLTYDTDGYGKTTWEGNDAWITSSKFKTPSLGRGDVQNMHKVEDPQSATSDDALHFVGALITRILRMHNQDALKNLPQ